MLESAGRKKVLIFCRFYFIDDFRNNFAPLASEYDLQYITDGHSPGAPDTRERFYAAFDDNLRSDLLSVDDVDQIISRCRYSRNVDRTLAERQVHAMTVAISEVIDRYAPDAIVSHMVDDYVGHIYTHLAQKRGINFVGYAHSYFPGMIQLTHGWNGAPFDVREPDDAEVDAIYEAISERTYRQNYSQNTTYGFAKHLKLFLKHQAKYPVFGMRSLLQRDRYNFHYRVTPFLADRKNLLNFPLNTDFTADWEGRLTKARADHPDHPIIYLPLAYAPESTIDYWIADRRPIDYEAFTLDVLGALSKSATVLVKEHVHMQGIRSRAFLHAVRDMPGVISVHPEAFSNNVLEQADAVLVGAGSVGIEASIRGKPVLTYGPDAYWFEGSRATPLPIDDLADWSAMAREAIAAHRPLTADERKQFIRRCLRSTVHPRGSYRKWPLVDIGDLRLILDQA